MKYFDQAICKAMHAHITDGTTFLCASGDMLRVDVIDGGYVVVDQESQIVSIEKNVDDLTDFVAKWGTP